MKKNIIRISAVSLITVLFVLVWVQNRRTHVEEETQSASPVFPVPLSWVAVNKRNNQRQPQEERVVFSSRKKNMTITTKSGENRAIIEIDHGLTPVNLLGGERYSDDVQRGKRKGATGAITLRVVDSTGAPVAGAELFGGFWNNNPDDPPATGTSDANGELSVKGLCTGDFNFQITKDGYYKTSLRYWFFKNGFDCAKDGRWLPWNPTVEVILKCKINPIGMYAFDYTANYTLIPKIGEPLGFDFMEGDWISPYGKGNTSDIEITYNRDGEGVNFTNQELVLTTSEPFAGFVRLKSDTFSAFKSPHYAATNAFYVQELRFYFNRPPDGKGGYLNGQLQDNECLVFRSRTRVDESGHLTGAHYGKIYGPFIFGASYKAPGSMKPFFYLNPTENDTNLEYDPRKNLLYPQAGNTPP